MAETDGEALSKAIIANPADNVARLVYADWLDENAEVFGARAGTRDSAKVVAEFIRLQIKVAWKQATKKDVRRIRTSHDRVAKIYLGALPESVDGLEIGRAKFDMDVRFHGESDAGGLGAGLIGLLTRGFVSEIVCTWAQFKTHQATIRSIHPLEVVWLSTNAHASHEDVEFFDARGPADGVYHRPGPGYVMTKEELKTLFPGLTFHTFDQTTFYFGPAPGAPVLEYDPATNTLE